MLENGRTYRITVKKTSDVITFYTTSELLAENENFIQIIDKTGLPVTINKSCIIDIVEKEEHEEDAK